MYTYRYFVGSKLFGEPICYQILYFKGYLCGKIVGLKLFTGCSK